MQTALKAGRAMTPTEPHVEGGKETVFGLCGAQQTQPEAKG